MRASSPPSGSLRGCLGLSHSTMMQRAALESYLPAPPPNWATPRSLLGSGGPRAVQGGPSQVIPPRVPDALSILLSHGPHVHASLPASSCHLLQSLKTRRAGSYLPLPLVHSLQPSSPWAERGSSLFREEPLGWVLRAWFLTLLERRWGSLQVPTGCASHEGSRPFSWPLVGVVSVGSRPRGEGTPSPDEEQACCTRGESLNAVPLGHDTAFSPSPVFTVSTGEARAGLGVGGLLWSLHRPKPVAGCLQKQAAIYWFPGSRSSDG